MGAGGDRELCSLHGLVGEGLFLIPELDVK